GVVTHLRVGSAGIRRPGRPQGRHQRQEQREAEYQLAELRETGRLRVHFGSSWIWTPFYLVSISLSLFLTKTRILRLPVRCSLRRRRPHQLIGGGVALGDDLRAAPAGFHALLLPPDAGGAEAAGRQAIVDHGQEACDPLGEAAAGAVEVLAAAPRAGGGETEDL